ncbi:MAG: hypothetical protein QHJ73_09035 [Armatimonadota bacterium]|nr:hypothetical protein [Armatimonadota bacterium]
MRNRTAVAKFGLAMVVLGGALAQVFAAPSSVRGPETQLAGIQLGKPAATVAKAYGSPRRIQVGTVTAPGTAAQAMPGMEGMGAPGMEGAAPGMAPPGAAPPGMDMGMAAPPGASPAMPGAPGMEGMAGAGQQAQVPKHVHWIYELHKMGVVLIFGFDEEGRVVSITVGDGYADSVNRGGTRRVDYPARTARGIKLGDPFRAVIAAYGYPETQQSVGEEVVLTYYDKYGVAFSMKQKVMRVTAITIREIPKTE